MPEPSEQKLDTPPNPHNIHRVIREEGEGQLGRHSGALAWSGLAAGLSMGFSYLTMALIMGRLPEGAVWRPLLGGFGYTVGFLIVILGRQQLFTESTLTSVLPLLSRFSVARLGQLFRYWAVVLGTNLIGTWLFAWGVAHEGLFQPGTWREMQGMAALTVAEPFWSTVFRAVLSGWLIALMVWMLPSAGSAKMLIIVVLTYVVGMAQLPHVIAGSCEAAFAVLAGGHHAWTYVEAFLVPTLLGNTIGGVALVAMLNYAPLATEA